MRRSITRLALLLACTAMFSCNGGKRAEAPPSPLVSLNDTVALRPDTLAEEQKEERSVPVAVDELFSDFMDGFSSSRRFQLGRVHFPLAVYTDGDTAAIERKQWVHDNLLSQRESYTLLFDNESDMDLETDTTLLDARVEWVSLDSVRQKTTYHFVKEKRRWMLQAIEQRPLSDDAAGSFVDFYTRFATDSIFQGDHVANPMEFVTVDPDDEFSILETTLGLTQWYAFRPMLPTDRLTNIDYGQTIDDRSATKILKLNSRHSATFSILYFRKRDGRWEMYRYEDTSI